MKKPFPPKPAAGKPGKGPKAPKPMMPTKPGAKPLPFKKGGMVKKPGYC